MQPKSDPMPTAMKRVRLMLFGMMAMVALVIVQEPTSRGQPPSPDQPKAQETKKAESEKPDSKTSETKSDQPKVAVPKAPGPETAEPKSPEIKPSEPRSQEAKPPQSQPSGSKSQASDAPPLQPRSPKAPEPSKQIPKAEEPTKPELKPSEPVGKKPVGSPILTAKLALMADPRVFPYEIEVDLNEQRIVLSGKVSSDAEKLAAQEVAQRVEGIKAVVNDLEVVKELPRALARKRDDLLTQLVQDRFRKSKTLETAEFDVKTEDGVVSLSGHTRFQVIILEAAEAARQVPGVKAVNAGGVRLEGGE